jgi:2-desacetyl-2-hydroxyethyl bacteriochlorophyllide A dehydrogenase
MKMRAIQVAKPGEMKLVQCEIPKIVNDADVLLKVKAVGICGSDVHIAQGTNPYATYPRIPGHEIAGEVAEVGNSVESLKKGDKVVLEPITYCGKCYACKKGRHNVCEDIKVNGVHIDGGFQEYMVVDQKQLYKFPEEISFVQAATAEPYTIGEQANSRAGTSAGDVVLIHGAGPMGLVICDVAKSKGATCIVSELNEKRLNMAKDFGADYLINPLKDNLREKVLEYTNGMGPNVIFEATGVPSLLSETVEMVSVAGAVVPLSFDTKPIPINFQQVNKKEVTIAGTRLQYDKFPTVIASLKDRIERINKFITHVFPVEEYEDAFNTFTDKNSGACKVILTF